MTNPKSIPFSSHSDGRQIDDVYPHVSQEDESSLGDPSSSETKTPETQPDELSRAARRNRVLSDYQWADQSGGYPLRAIGARSDEYWEVPGDIRDVVVETVDDLTDRAFNEGGGKDREYLFELARRLQGHLLTQGVDVATVKPIEFSDAALMFRDGIASAMDFMPMTERRHDWDDDAHVLDEFRSGWRKVKVPIRAWDLAVKRADKSPIRLISPDMHHLSMGSAETRLRLNRMASIFYHLQIAADDNDIYLQRVALGQLFGMKKGSAPSTIGRLVENLRDMGLLTCTDPKYKPGKLGQGYRFNLDRTDLYAPPSE